MDSGIRISWGSIIAGREREALDLFDFAVKYFGGKHKGGAITSFEPYFVRTTDQELEQGFMLVKGPVTEIFKIMEDEEYLTLLSKAYYLVNHFKVDMLTVGDALAAQLERSAKVRAELGI